MNHNGIVERIVGAVEWRGSWGFCKCPGASLHTGRNAKSDCKVFTDNIHTIHCLHSSCSVVVAQSNKQLRREVWKAEKGMAGWTDEQIKKRKKTPAELDMEDGMRRKQKMRAEANSLKLTVFRDYAQTVKDAFLSSPVRLDHTPEQDYALFLDLFKDDDILWQGNVTDSKADDPSYARYFLPKSEWARASRPIGQFTSGSVFKSGTHSRSNSNVSIQRYLVVESDTLSRDQICAVFNWMSQYHRLAAIVDTAGRSLHGWFDRPSDAQMEKLKIYLPILGCDPALFKPSQPVRIPGARRDGLFQSLVWLADRRTK